MKVKILMCAALLAASATLPASAQQITQIAQDKDFQDANMRWTGATAKGYDGRIAVKVMGGNLVLCGVGVTTNIQLSSAITKGLRGGTVKLNGKTVLKDFSYFAKARNASDLKTAKANCKSTGVPVPKKIDSLQVRYGKATFRN